MSWLYNFIFNYWWPSIKGNGPEDATSLLIVGIVTAIVVPAVRHWIAREVSHVHAKLDHIILHHPDIPNEIPGLPEHRQPKPVVSLPTPPPEQPGQE